MDKYATGGVVLSAGIPSLAARALLSPGSRRSSFAGPYIVKPRYGGSSIGIEVVSDEATARARLGASVHLRRGAVIEPYREDLFDLQIGVRTYPELELSMIERPIRQTDGAEILDYADKYVGGTGMDAAERELPAEIPEALAEEIRAHATVAASALSIRGVARIDFLSDGVGELYFNEVNTIPGSLSRYLFSDSAVPFTVLLGDLFREAIDRPTARFSTAGADGTVLRERHHRSRRSSAERCRTRRALLHDDEEVIFELRPHPIRLCLPDHAHGGRLLGRRRTASSPGRARRRGSASSSARSSSWSPPISPPACSRGAPRCWSSPRAASSSAPAWSVAVGRRSRSTASRT